MLSSKNALYKKMFFLKKVRSPFMQKIRGRKKYPSEQLECPFNLVNIV